MTKKQLFATATMESAVDIFNYINLFSFQIVGEAVITTIVATLCFFMGIVASDWKVQEEELIKFITVFIHCRLCRKDVKKYLIA